MRYVFLIEYDGTHFAGWQEQKNARTVQSVLSEAAASALGTQIKFTASGRTDAGVHAMGQVAQADFQTNIPANKLRECLNAKLPPDVRILQSAVAPSDFDCTRGAKKKTYVYRAYYARSERPTLSRYYAKLEKKPNLSAMKTAAKLLEGEHDFAAFRAAGYTSKTSVRTIYSLTVSERDCNGAWLYEISVTGNGFLYNMVRILAGELFAVGMGKEEAITEAFLTKERKVLAKTMPAKGLMMMNVEYQSPLFGEEE